MEVKKNHPTSTPERKTKTKATPYDAADYLKTESGMAALLDAALEDGHPQVIAAALGAIARARGMTRLAKETGLSREALYRSLSPDGNPELSTLLKVIGAMGYKLRLSMT